MESGRAINIADLVHGIGQPDYPPMPSSDESIPLG
jgi:hypothetical protein